uniref:Thioesterase domain-containing protein n=1 Tax=Oryza punctata TaxID=4537 RepID=A0A0E0K371_ORYPU
MIKQPSVSLAPNTSCHPQHALSRAAAAAGSARSHRTTCLHLAVLHVGRHSHRRHARALCSHEAFSAKNNTNHDVKLRARKFFEMEMSVRDCELDQYGVVNNVVYASYVERAREELAEFLGVSASTVACTGNAMAVSEQNLKYFTPLKHGNKFVVKVTIQIKGVRIYADQFIETLPDRKLVLEAKATIVCLNREYRPTRVFPELSSKQPSVGNGIATNASNPQHALPTRAGSSRSRRSSLHLAGRHSHRWCHARALCAAPNLHSREAIVSAKDNTNQDPNLRARKFFELEMSVSDCDIDQYGVVNNAVYANYVERAREELAAILGVSASTVACTGKAMAISEQNLKYLNPLKLVLESTATIVCLNGEHRPTRVFPELSSKLLDFFSPQESCSD